MTSERSIRCLSWFAIRSVVGFLLLNEKLQRSPRYIPSDVALSASRFDVCHLHERVDVNNFKYTFLLGNAHAGASLRDGPTVFGNHLVLLSPALTCAACHQAGYYISHSYAPRLQ